MYGAILTLIMHKDIFVGCMGPFSHSSCVKTSLFVYGAILIFIMYKDTFFGYMVPFWYSSCIKTSLQGVWGHSNTHHVYKSLYWMYGTILILIMYRYVFIWCMVPFWDSSCIETCLLGVGYSDSHYKLMSTGIFNRILVYIIIIRKNKYEWNEFSCH